MRYGRVLGILVWRQMENSKGRGPGQRDPAHVVLSSQLHPRLQLNCYCSRSIGEGGLASLSMAGGSALKLTISSDVGEQRSQRVTQ